jgi:hypothetical protein
MKTRKFSLAAVLATSSAFAFAGALASAAEGKDDSSAARGDTATQERSAQEGKAGASTFTARVPVLVMVPMEFKVDPQEKGCWSVRRARAAARSPARLSRDADHRRRV